MSAARRALRLAPRYLVMAPLAAAFLFPFYWMLVISLSTQQEAYTFPPHLFPTWHFENFVTAWLQALWGRYAFNTAVVAGSTTALVLATSTLAGYAFAAMSFPGKAAVFGLVLAVYMVPTEVTLVPNFIILRSLGWIDTYQAQIAPFAASVFGIFLMRQFFLTLPRELWEAAQLDGCSHLRFLWTIATPLAAPALITTALFHFVLSWNAFLWPLIVTTSDSVRPVQVGLVRFQYAESTDPVLIAAGSLMVTLPVLIIFLLAQKRLVGGIATSGLRG